MKYTKMHGAGNSFVIVEDFHNELAGADLPRLAVHLCAQGEKKTDGMMVVCPSAPPADFGMLFYNNDGSVGEMCGNGARCICRYGYEHGYAPDPEKICVQATAGLVTGRRLTQELYEIRLNDPTVIDLHRKAEALGKEYDCAYIELGDPGLPHAVVLAKEADFEDMDLLREKGRALRRSAAFPKGANVTFVLPLGGKNVKAITFERGVEDFTLACGTGCGATATALILRGVIPGSEVQLDMPGGHLSVTLTADGSFARNLLLTGPTAVVGEYESDTI